MSRVYFRYAGWLAAAGVLIPVIDESIQYLVPGRAPEVADVLLDIAGFACGALLVTAIVALRARKARRPEPRP